MDLLVQHIFINNSNFSFCSLKTGTLFVLFPPISYHSRLGKRRVTVLLLLNIFLHFSVNNTQVVYSPVQCGTYLSGYFPRLALYSAEWYSPGFSLSIQEWWWRREQVVIFSSPPDGSTAKKKKKHDRSMKLEKIEPNCLNLPCLLHDAPQSGRCWWCDNFSWKI